VQVSIRVEAGHAVSAPRGVVPDVKYPWSTKTATGLAAWWEKPAVFLPILACWDVAKGRYRGQMMDFAGYIPATYLNCSQVSTGDRVWDVRAEAHMWRTSSRKVALKPVEERGPLRMGSKLRAGTDAFRSISFVDPSGAYLQEAALNYPGMVRNVERPGPGNDISVNWEGFLHQRTSGGKIRPRKDKEYRSFLPGMVNHHNDSPEESLCAAHRLGQRRSKPTLTYEAKAYAERITQEAFREHWLPNFKLDELEINATVDKALADMKARNYAKRGMAELKKRGMRPLLTFSNKDQVKPIKGGKLDLGKSGQGILQAPAYVAAEFAPWMRVLNLHFRRAARDHYFYDNLVSKEEFDLELTKALKNLPESALYGIVDGEEFDAWQNEVTLHMEKEFRRLQGAHSESIEAYYKIRGPQQFTMFGCFKGRTNFEKGSGFLDTLLGNSTLQTIAGNQIFEGVGPKVVAAKGDDYMEARSGLRINEEKLLLMQAILGMRWKVSIGNGGEFCGNSVSRAGSYSSIVRATLKAIAAKSRNYAHFCEQQKAYRDKIQEIRAVGIENNITANCLAENRQPEYVSLCFDILNSLAHIGQEQWLAYTKGRKNPVLVLPSAGGPTML
jgi:hypothetical protein